MTDPNTTNRRRQWVVLAAALTGIGALVSAGMYLFEAPPKQVREKPHTVKLTPPGNLEDRDIWRHKESARIKNTESSISDIERKQKRYEEDNQRIQQALDELKSGKAAEQEAARSAERKASAARAKAVLDSPLPAVAGGTRSVILPSPSGATAKATLGGRSTEAEAPAPAVGLPPIEIIAFGGATEATASRGTTGSTGSTGPTGPTASAVPAPRGKEEVQTVDLIPAGSFVRVVMLNGVDAPTGGQAQSNPLPIAFHVEDTANLANKYRLDIRDCRIIASAWGDLSSERTMGRTESLNCIIDGVAAEMSIKGTIMGEDGKVGIRGRLVTKQGQILANALLAGGLAGIGRAFQSAATTTTSGAGGVTETIDPTRVAQAGIGGGVGQAGSMLAQYYLKAADKLFPVIETDGGRVVEILVTKSAVYTGKTGGDQYRALLRRAGASERNSHED